MPSNNNVSNTTPEDRALPKTSGVLLSTVKYCLFLGVLLIMTHNSAWSAQLRLLDLQHGCGDLQQFIILDARPRSQWQQGHLPGAHSLSWEDYTSTDSSGVKYRILPPQQLAQRLGSMGIDNQSKILIYADADSSWGGEGWLAWMLSWLGHQGPIYILNGGIAAWSTAGLPLNKQQPTAVATTYTLNMQPQLTISAEQLADNAQKYTIIDTRNYWKEWLLGHLPHAIHIDWKNFYQGNDRRVLPPAQLKKLLKDNGVNLDKPVVYYCTGGIRSGFAWMVHTLAGLPTAINFEGGIEEWNHYQQQRQTK